MHLRCVILTVLQVSLFLAEGIQGPGGRMILPGCVANDVGLVRSFDMSGKVEYEERLTLGSQLVRTIARIEGQTVHEYDASMMNDMMTSETMGGASGMMMHPSKCATHPYMWGDSVGGERLYALVSMYSDGVGTWIWHTCLFQVGN